jgi:hypothetical protein
MMTTENNMNKDATLEDVATGTRQEKNMNKDATLEDAENGMRQRAGKNPSALTSASKALSQVSMRYDIDGDGKLDPSEKAMRDMDIDNRGYLTNDQVYKVMLEQMKLQQEVFGLKRMSMVFVFIIFFLSLATLGTSFAAASLAKDTDVKNGILVVKGGDGVVGTSNVASTFTLTEVALSGRRLAINGNATYGGITVTAITKEDAAEVAIQCGTGGTVFLTETCITSGSQSPTTIDVPICPSTETAKIEDGELIYTYKQGTVTITCSVAGASTETCVVAFAEGTRPACTALTPPVILGTANKYAIIAKAGITNVPDSFITGDIAVSPIAATSMTGFSFFKDDDQNTVSVQITGKAFAASDGGSIAAALTVAVLDMQTAYVDAAGRTNPDSARKNIDGGDLNDITLTPGIYTFGTFVTITGDIYLRGNEDDVFIIQIASYLFQAAEARVILVGGVQAKNVFWQVAGYVYLGAGSHMEGVLLVATAVTFITGSSINGRVLSQTACVLQSATIDSRICSNSTSLC